MLASSSAADLPFLGLGEEADADLYWLRGRWSSPVGSNSKHAQVRSPKAKPFLCAPSSCKSSMSLSSPATALLRRDTLTRYELLKTSHSV